MPKIIRKSKPQQNSKKSYRTTIPLFIVEQFEITPESILNWVVDIESNEIKIVIEKADNE